jgi:hypothetical protein
MPQPISQTYLTIAYKLDKRDGTLPAETPRALPRPPMT